MYYPSSENKGADQLRGYRTAKLICVFVFAYADCWFSHEVTQFMFTLRLMTARTINLESCTLELCGCVPFEFNSTFEKLSVMIQKIGNLNSGKQRVPDQLYSVNDSLNMSRLMGKPTICIGENKDADQLRGNCEADQRLCFRYSDSTIPVLLKSEISRF